MFSTDRYKLKGKNVQNEISVLILILYKFISNLFEQKDHVDKDKWVVE